MTGLSLFSGAGIGELVFKHIFPDYRTIGYVEWDKYCQAVIRQRIKDGWLDDAPIFGDIRQFNERYASLYTGRVDWLSGGFPCQPFSVAGRQLGEADERNMWPATRDAIRILRPRYCFLENVPGLLSHGYIYRILADLAEIGYDAEWDIVGATTVGLPHIRRRLWVVAHPVGKRVARPSESACVGEALQSPGELWRLLGAKGVCNWDKDRLIGPGASSIHEPCLWRANDGLPNWVDRLKAVGNAWCPAVVARVLEVNSGDAR